MFNCILLICQPLVRLLTCTVFPGAVVCQRAGYQWSGSWVYGVSRPELQRRQCRATLLHCWEQQAAGTQRVDATVHLWPVLRDRRQWTLHVHSCRETAHDTRRRSTVCQERARNIRRMSLCVSIVYVVCQVHYSLSPFPLHSFTSSISPSCHSSSCRNAACREFCASSRLQFITAIIITIICFHTYQRNVSTIIKQWETCD